MARCSRMRLVEVHHWPALEKPAVIAASTALPRSASSITMRAFFPPSSSWVRVRFAAALIWIFLPTSVEPVNEIARTRGSPTSTLPMDEPGPVTQLKTPGGNPARSNRRAMKTPDHGVNDAGLKTTVLPVSNAGNVFRHITFIGKFHGLITADDADRLVLHPRRHVAERARPGMAVEGRDLVQVVAALDQGRIDFGPRLADGLAVFQRDDTRQLVARCRQQSQELGDVLLTLRQRRASPRRERLGRGVDGVGDVVGGRCLKQPKVAASHCGVLVFERGAVRERASRRRR